MKSRPDSKWKLDIRTSVKGGAGGKPLRGRMLPGDNDSYLSED